MYFYKPKKDYIMRSLLILFLTGLVTLVFSIVMVTSEECVKPTNEIVITKDTTFCKGTYNLAGVAATELDLLRAIKIGSNDLTLNCDGAVINGTKAKRSVGISVLGRGNVKIRNCVVQNYDLGVSLSNTRDVTLEDNIINENSIGLFTEYPILNTFLARNVLCKNLGTDIQLYAIHGQLVPDMQGNLINPQKWLGNTSGEGNYCDKSSYWKDGDIGDPYIKLGCTFSCAQFKPPEEKPSLEKPPAPCTSNIPFEDNFDDGNYDGWTVEEGRFSASKSALEVKSDWVVSIARPVNIDFSKDVNIEFDIFFGGGKYLQTLEDTVYYTMIEFTLYNQTNDSRKSIMGLRIWGDEGGYPRLGYVLNKKYFRARPQVRSDHYQISTRKGSTDLFINGVKVISTDPISPENALMLRFHGNLMADTSIDNIKICLAGPEKPKVVQPVSKTIKVPAKSGWIDTGVKIEAGKTFFIEVSGNATYGFEGECNCKPVTQPDGSRFFEGKMVPLKYDDRVIKKYSPIGMLIGRVGDGELFFINPNYPSKGWISYNTTHILRLGPGHVYAFPVNTSGNLYLRYNDAVGFYNDNEGEYTVKIEEAGIEKEKPVVEKPKILSATATPSRVPNDGQTRVLIEVKTDPKTPAKRVSADLSTLGVSGPADLKAAGSGLHTLEIVIPQEIMPGIYSISFTAENEAGSVKEKTTIEVTGAQCATNAHCAEDEVCSAGKCKRATVLISFVGANYEGADYNLGANNITNFLQQNFFAQTNLAACQGDIRYNIYPQKFSIPFYGPATPALLEGQILAMGIPYDFIVALTDQPIKVFGILEPSGYTIPGSHVAIASKGSPFIAAHEFGHLQGLKEQYCDCIAATYACVAGSFAGKGACGFQISQNPMKSELGCPSEDFDGDGQADCCWGGGYDSVCLGNVGFNESEKAKKIYNAGIYQIIGRINKNVRDLVKTPDIKETIKADWALLESKLFELGYKPFETLSEYDKEFNACTSNDKEGCEALQINIRFRFSPKSGGHKILDFKTRSIMAAPYGLLPRLDDASIAFLRGRERLQCK